MSNNGKSSFLIILALLVGISGAGLGAYSAFFQAPIPGPPGVDGIDGIDGVDGTNGTDGVDGEDGIGAGEPIFFCSSESEIDDALTNIGIDSGTIVITENIILSAPIVINQMGSYIIQGVAPSIYIDCNGDRSAIRIEYASSCIIRDLTIRAEDITSTTTNIIFVSEPFTHIENVRIIGDAGRRGRGIYVDCQNVWISNCHISEVLYGIFGLAINAHYLHVSDNTVLNCADGSIGEGIYLGGDYSTCDNNYVAFCHLGIFVIGYQCAVSNNVLYGNFERAINLATDYSTISGNSIRGIDPVSATNLYGIYVDSGSDYNVFSGNLVSHYINSGAGTGVGILIVSNSCDENTIVGNTFLNCDTPINDLGTNTYDYYNNIA